MGHARTAKLVYELVRDALWKYWEYNNALFLHMNQEKNISERPCKIDK